MRWTALLFLLLSAFWLNGCSQLPSSAVGPQGGGAPLPLNEQEPLPRAFAPPRPMRRQRLNAGLGRFVIPNALHAMPADLELETALAQELQEQDFSVGGDDTALEAALEQELQGQDFSVGNDDFALQKALEQELQGQDFSHYMQARSV